MLKQRNYNEMVTYILDKIREMDISEDDKKALFAYITCLESKYFMEMGNAERKGKWIRKDDEQCYWYECSECGHLPPKDTFKQEWLSHFCPNCGARMARGEEDDS